MIEVLDEIKEIRRICDRILEKLEEPEILNEAEVEEVERIKRILDVADTKLPHEHNPYYRTQE